MWDIESCEKEAIKKTIDAVSAILATNSSLAHLNWTPVLYSWEVCLRSTRHYQELDTRLPSCLPDSEGKTRNGDIWSTVTSLVLDLFSFTVLSGLPVSHSALASMVLVDDF